MIIVGELINATRKAVKAAIEARDRETIQSLAKDQAEAKADYIDVNAGVFVENEAGCLKWVIDEVLEAVPEVPFCIDSSSPKAIETAVGYLREKTSLVPMVNSISLETGRFDALIPLLAGTDLKVVALCMSSEGMPETTDQRVSVADKLINKLVNNNIPLENIHVDPLVQSLGTNSDYGMAFLTAVERIMTEFPGVHTMCGLSNISFGMPARPFLNQNFMVMAIARGLDGAIVNPLDRKMMANIITAEALAGKDSYCMNFLKAYRAGAIPG
jgi:5-methyltetrahydrofolate corrinoid/iron sulfur protein methyltransferase